MHIRSPYDIHECLEFPVGESMTEQSHAEASDINYIVRRFQRTGHLPPVTREGVYADCTNLSGPLLDRIQWAEGILSDHEAQIASENTPTTSPEAPQGASTTPTPTTLQAPAL